MEKRGIDALIVSDPSNMAWLTGYDGWSFYVHQAVVLPIDDDPVWFGRSQDANGAHRTTWMARERIESYADHYVQSTERHQIGRAHVCTPVTNAHLVCRLLLE